MQQQSEQWPASQPASHTWHMTLQTTDPALSFKKILSSLSMQRCMILGGKKRVKVVDKFHRPLAVNKKYSILTVDTKALYSDELHGFQITSWKLVNADHVFLRSLIWLIYISLGLTCIECSTEMMSSWPLFVVAIILLPGNSSEIYSGLIIALKTTPLPV